MANLKLKKNAYTGDGEIYNSDILNGLTIEDGKQKIINLIEEKKIGVKKINYKLRDWGISRQRFGAVQFQFFIEKMVLLLLKVKRACP